MASSTTTSIGMTSMKLQVRNYVIPAWPNPKDSINDADDGTLISRKKYCWFVQGPALQAYDTIRDYLMRIVEERGSDLYETSNESFVPHSIDCFMIGRQKDNAHPYIVISCSQEQFSKTLMKVIKSSKWWVDFEQRNKGFGRFLLLRYPPKRMANIDEHNPIWIYTSNQIISPYDIPIFSTTDRLKPDDPCRARQATLGNFLYLDGEPYGLTVAHPFIEQCYNSVPEQVAPYTNTVFHIDDSDGDSDVDSSSPSPSSSDSMQQDGIFENEGGTREDSIDGSPLLLGRLVSRSHGTASDNVDWALIKLEESGEHFVETLRNVGESLSTDSSSKESATIHTCPRSIADTIEDVVPVFTSGTGDCPVKGVLSASRSLVCLHGSSRYLSLRNVQMTEDLAPGDCGKWIVDMNGVWYGHVVAGIPGSRTAFIASAAEIVNEIHSTRKVKTIELTEPSNVSQALFMTTDAAHNKLLQTLIEEEPDTIDSQSESPTIRSNINLRKMPGKDKEQQALDEADDYTILHTASARGHEQTVRLLLDKGADVNNPGGMYGTPLHAASVRGCEQIVRLLLDRGADVNVTDGTYGTPLHVASVRGHEQTVRVLLEKGADVNIIHATHGNPLRAASTQGHKQIAQMLLARGAVNFRNSRSVRYNNISRVTTKKNPEADLQVAERGALSATQDYGVGQVKKHTAFLEDQNDQIHRSNSSAQSDLKDVYVEPEADTGFTRPKVHQKKNRVRKIFDSELSQPRQAPLVIDHAGTPPMNTDPNMDATPQPLRDHWWR